MAAPEHRIILESAGIWGEWNGPRSFTSQTSPHPEAEKHGLAVPFPATDDTLYGAVASLSSYTLRRLIGHDTYAGLVAAAAENGAPVASYCRDLIHQKINLDGSRSNRLHRSHQALQATFSGGRGAPLHDWYPYLEGYSPAFVEAILKQYAPNSQCVLDPFAGTGTTPITVAMLGLEAVYAELNPVCNAVTQAKANALRLEKDQRKRTADRLHQLAARALQHLRALPADKSLRSSYSAVFGDSAFFEPSIFKLILQARTWLDRITRTDALIGHFVEVALLRSLVPASRLIRRGDLRFKTEAEEARPKVEFWEAVQNSLRLIASDIAELGDHQAKIRFLGDDAKEVATADLHNIDALITSPPYLNGTNYFRNTKIELWFLRQLHNKADLGRFRYRAVTAGINDVTIGKTEQRRGLFESEKLSRIIGRLERSAYDRRIPQMIETYFGDIFLALRKSTMNLRADALIAIDIGDSCYGDVHIPTDDLLADMLTEAGCRLEDRVVLRERISRGGQPLRQTLQIFRRVFPHNIRTECKPVNHDWLCRWTTFKAELPHQRGEMRRRNWGHPLHSLCSYQGKLKPSIAHLLVNSFVPANGRILDPFAGVGTIPLEAALAGRKAFAFDISPPALEITRAKLGLHDRQSCEAVIADLADAVSNFPITENLQRQARAIRFNGALEDYFHPQTFSEILAAREFFLRNPRSTPSASLVFASLLHILHGNRPYALSRNSHPITPFAPSGPSIYRALLPRLRDKVTRSLAADRGPAFTYGSVYEQDATKPWPKALGQLDAIITSPPFFDSTRFHLGNWMRLWFCGWEASDFKSRPFDFVDERQKRSFEVYEPIFESSAAHLRPGGILVLHLGHSRKCDMATVLLPIALRRFRLADQFTESVLHCESHGVRDKGTVTAHHYLVLERA